MAKKEFVKKNTNDKTTKKVVAKKIEEVTITEPINHIEEVIENESFNNELEIPISKENDVIPQEEIIVEEKNTLDELIIMNEEEMVEKAKESIKVNKKENNDRASQRVDNIFGYLWNGQEMDY